MPPSDAFKLLDLPADASPEQIEARFLELRRKLEDKIAKAPTPGLQAIYRESLADITTAFETLTLAADSSALPVLQKQSPGAATISPADSRVASASDHQKSKAKNKKSGKEFLIVAIVAVVLLAAGGWFVMKTRAENAEKARSAAAAKAEQERAALAAQQSLDAKKNVDEAESVRLQKLSGQLRGELAEAKVIWDAIEREERTAERRLAELKTDLRSLRDVPAGKLAEARAAVAAQQEYYDWLSDTLARHPTKIARSKAEELLSARQVPEARDLVTSIKPALDELEIAVRQRRAAAVDLDGKLELTTHADTKWSLEDAFGRTRNGRGPAVIEGLGLGPGRLHLKKVGWPDRSESFVIARNRTGRLDLNYVGHDFAVASTPAGAEVWGADGARLGETPLSLTSLPPGPLALTLRKDAYYDQPVNVTLPRSDAGALTVKLQLKPTGLVKPVRWNAPAKVTLQVRSDTETFGPLPAKSFSQVVEQSDFSDADPKLGWRQAVRRFVSLSGTHREYMPVDGSVVRVRQQTDRTWKGEFVSGGLKDPAHNPIWANAASPWLIHPGLAELFPETEVEVGGTWAVKPEIFFSTIGLANYKGQVRGRLVALERQAAGEWADIEYTYSYTVATTSGDAVLKVHVNLADGYATRVEGTDSVKAGEIRVRATYTITVTTR